MSPHDEAHARVQTRVAQILDDQQRIAEQLAERSTMPAYTQSLVTEIDRLRRELHEQAARRDDEREQLQAQATRYAAELDKTRDELSRVAAASVEHESTAEYLRRSTTDGELVALASLEAQLSKAREMIRALEGDTGRLRAYAVGLEQAAYGQSQQIEQLRLRLSQIEHERDAALAQLRAVNDAMSQVSVEREELRDERDELKAELEQAALLRQRDADSLEQQKRQTLSARKLVDELKQERDDWRERAEERGARARRLTEESRDLAERLAQSQRDVAGLLNSDDGDRLRGELRDVQLDHRELVVELSTLRQQHKALHNELAAATAERDKLRASLEQQKSQTLGALKLIDELKQDRDKWRERVDKAKREIVLMREHVDELSKAHDARGHEIARPINSDDVERLRKLADAQTSYATRLEHEAVEIKKTIYRVVGERDRATARVEELSAELFKLRKIALDAQASHDERTRQFCAVEREQLALIEQLRLDLAASQSKIDSRDKRLHELARERVTLAQREHDAICAVRALARLLDDDDAIEPPF